MLKILLIEDEIKAARELHQLIMELRPDALIMNTLQSIEESLDWLRTQEPPQLIFSDIQLADGLSFDIFKHIQLHIPIIFCTAFDEYAIRAFEANGIDYLLKPIERNKLQQSLEKFDNFKKFFTPEVDYDNKLLQLFGQLQNRYKNTLLVHFKDQIIPLKTSDIAYLHSEHGLVSAHTHNNQKYSVDYTLEELENQLDPQFFYRANRQFIIRRDAIQNIQHFFARKLTVKLHYKTPENIIISKAKASDFLRWLENA